METLENKYIVIKRKEFTPDLWKKIVDEWFAREAQESNNYSLVISNEQHLLDILDGTMKLIDNDYFVMNLDESESVQAMHYYFRLKKESEILNKLTRLVQDVAVIDSDEQVSST